MAHNTLTILERSIAEAKANAELIGRNVLSPQPGKQTDFLRSRANIVLYGGAASGGKSYAGLLDPLRHINKPLFRGTAFRRETTDLRKAGGLFDESQKMYPLVHGHPDKQTLRWTFPTGALIDLQHMQYEKNVTDHQGAQYAHALFDEATTFEQVMIWGIWERLRSMAGVTAYLRMTCNPDSESWLRQFIDWWIGEDGYPIEARSGVIRWFLRDPSDDSIRWHGDPEVLKAWYRRKFPDALIFPNPISFTFISANITDNPILMKENPTYADKLASTTKVRMERLLKGNWDIKAGKGDYFQEEWCGSKVDMAHVDPRWTFMWGVDMATAGEDKGDWCCATLMARDNDGVFYVVDHEYERMGPAKTRPWLKKILQKYPFANQMSFPQNPGDAGKQNAYDVVSTMAGIGTVVTSLESGKKAERLEPFTAQASVGNVKLVRGEWNARFCNVLTAFPEAKHDDDADSCSRSFNALAEVAVFDFGGLE